MLLTHPITLLVALMNLSSTESRPNQLLVMVPYDPHPLNIYNVGKPEVQPLVQMALDDVVKSGILRRSAITVEYRDSKCSDMAGPTAAIEAYKEARAISQKFQRIQFFFQNKVDAFLGPVCSYAVAPIARYSSAWGSGIPVITTTGHVEHFDDKNEYKLLVRMTGSYSELGRVLGRLFESKGFAQYHLAYQAQGKNLGASEYQLASIAVYTQLRKSLNQSTDKNMFKYNSTGFDEHTPVDDSKETLKEVSTKANVIVVCASPEMVRKIMLAAYELGMTGGEYVFFNLDILAISNATKPWLKADRSAEENEKARQAYRALKQITLLKSNSTQYSSFENRVRKVANVRFDYQNVTGKVYQLNSFTSAFYDAVTLYALALNETLSRGGSKDNGTEITHRMWNRSFEGINGRVTIDDNGDRFSDYSLIDLNPESGDFEPVLSYFGAKKSIDEVGKWHWIGGQQPKDLPVCGYDHSLCPTGLTVIHWISIAFVIALCAFLVLFFGIYRHYKQEAELMAMTWKISYADLYSRSHSHTNNVNNGGGGGDAGGALRKWDSRTSVAKSINSEESIALLDVSKQAFTERKMYKGTLVAIKNLNISKPKIELSRALLLELKKMKDIQNDNVTRFIGACVDAPHYQIVTEYCSRGSLQDILENDGIRLDKLMLYSLMHDLVKGLDFIHYASELKSHGNLKSSNCVVDGRFVLKVTDFGLNHLRKLEDPMTPEDNLHAYWRRFYWTAPELLELARPPLEGTPKGDVYSFAIILHEMCYRKGTFFVENEEDLSPEEKIERVKQHADPPYRPTVLDECVAEVDESVIKLMVKCWAEDPLERPDITTIRKQIRLLNKQNETSNIVDNLLKRMEQYADNLEELVQHKTADWLDEKKKAEDLLYQLLPRPVARQLIAGESVKAEAFDGVTIYFSDIVGFTALSAQSTPMEVVNLLNDLYTCFDSIIENMDVYKVETIGDAYMVVSGLPVRNGTLHAREICRMALALLSAVRSFKIRHRANEKLNLRIGIHSGPVCAGVVGLRMPRYCLFGDTVNTASRMESNGEPLKIHVSAATKSLLDQFGTFDLQLRGEVEMKGKGKQETYWLLKEHTDSR